MSQEKTTPDPRSILVIQLRRIGDVLLTTPALAALKDRYPCASIDFLVEPPSHEVLEGNPHLREIIIYRARGWLGAALWLWKIKRKRYEWVIDYMGNPRSAILTACSGAALRAGPAHAGHRWAYNRPLLQSSTTQYGGLEKILVLRELGVDAPSPTCLPRVYFNSEEAPPKNRIGLVPASRRGTRRWPAASYARLGRMLRDKYQCEINVFWGPKEKKLAEEVAAGIGEGATITTETKTLKEAAGLMARCRLIITNCNGPKHLAVALGVPTLTIHGSSDPLSWNPPHPRHQVVREEELMCIGCGLNDCPYRLECLKGLAPEKVFAAARRLL